MTGASNHSLRSVLGMIDDRTIGGFVLDDARPNLKFVVEILTDGIPVAAVRADAFSPALATQGVSDAYHGFIHPLALNFVNTSQIISARLANIGTSVDPPVNLEKGSRPDPRLSAQGAVDRVDGRVVSGWVFPDRHSTTMVHAMSAGEEIAATEPRVWTTTQVGGETRPVLAFKLKLPNAIANGEPHTVSIVNGNGTSLVGSPFSLTLSKLEGSDRQ